MLMHIQDTAKLNIYSTTLSTRSFGVCLGEMPDSKTLSKMDFREPNETIIRNQSHSSPGAQIQHEHSIFQVSPFDNTLSTKW